MKTVYIKASLLTMQAQTLVSSTLSRHGYLNAILTGIFLDVNATFFTIAYSMVGRRVHSGFVRLQMIYDLNLVLKLAFVTCLFHACGTNILTVSLLWKKHCAFNKHIWCLIIVQTESKLKKIKLCNKNANFLDFVYFKEEIFILISYL